MLPTLDYYVLIDTYPVVMSRRIAAALGAGLVALVALTMVEPQAAAHAAYKYSNPDDESTVAQAPTEIWAEYTEPPTDASYLQVYDPCGAQVDNGDSRADPAQNRVYITMSSGRAGTYQVDWFVDSAVDAHSTRGTFTFTVTNGEPCPGAETEKEDTERRAQPAPRRESSNRNAPDTASDLAAGDAPLAGSTGGRRDRSEQRDATDRTRASGRDRSRETESVAAADTGEVKPQEPGLFEGIPVAGLLLALGLAAGIGGAGGLIYAGIMGYNRS